MKASLCRLILLISFFAGIANAEQLAPSKVTKETFSITLPSALTHASPAIKTKQNMMVYSFTDKSANPDQVMTIMVVKYDPKIMGNNIDQATKDFTAGILLAHTKSDSHPVTFTEVYQAIHPTQMNHQQYQLAEYTGQNSLIHIYGTHTQNKIYGFVFSSRNIEGVTEMRVALSRINLFN